ncbi:unnamed protein product [Rotaria sp. Silwood1]|nr:unnamed protein product [Rotaria sp. Silwood1]
MIAVHFGDSSIMKNQTNNQFTLSWSRGISIQVTSVFVNTESTLVLNVAEAVSGELKENWTLAYLIYPTSVSSVIDELPPPPQAPNRVDSILSYLDEANRNDVIVESVRSQKSTTREISTPATVRFTTPPQSTRQQQQQQPKKLSQSVSITQHRASPSVDQQAKQGTKITTPHKSLTATVQPVKSAEEDIEDEDREATRTAQDVTETVLQLRMDNEEKQRQLIIFQQRLNQQRELNIRHAKESERELEHRLQLQKDDYEATIQRHLTFIDQVC